ncbi:MAG: Mitochondrial matrix cochaperone [Claussenomyces sp. TS43310]|nr:MAG: Mitochondrial matrix cochaperone [Claussenomyces sp. TS43310]
MIHRVLLRQCRTRHPGTRPLLQALPALSRSHINGNLYPQSLQHVTAKFYTTKPENQADANGEVETTGQGQKGTDRSAGAIAKELEAKDKEIIDLKDKFLRSMADYRNLQERTKREVQAAKDFAIQRFSKDLVESIDNLDRALAMVPEEKLTEKEKEEHTRDLVNLYDGLKMTESILMQTLKKHGLERFDPSVEGEKFNPNEHEATFMTAVDGKEDNTVFFTQQKGFKLNGRILRAAKVGVVKNQ